MTKQLIFSIAIKVLYAFIFLLSPIVSFSQYGFSSIAHQPIGETYAIVIGISGYPNVKPVLNYCDDDARLFIDFLQSKAGGNVKTENIKVLLNENAKSADIQCDAYKWLMRKNLTSGNRLFIYFSGHGFASNEDNYYLLPYDCKPNLDTNLLPFAGGVEMYHIKTDIIKPLIKKGVQVILIVDACRSNGSGLPINDKLTEKNDEGLEIIMLSCSAGTASREHSSIGGGHGLFTYYLVDALNGAAKKKNGMITLENANTYVSEKVKTTSDSLFQDEQQPVFLPMNSTVPISFFDSVCYSQWVASQKKMETGGELLSFNNPYNARKAIDSTASAGDSILQPLYGHFLAALKKEKLTGDSSAEYYYGLMAKALPESNLTLDARYTLATKMVNFAQDKINQYLDGKSNFAVRRESVEFSKLQMRNTGQQVSSHLLALSDVDYKKASALLLKAMELFGDDSVIYKNLQPKSYFLQALDLFRPAVGTQTQAETKTQFSLIRKAIELDPYKAYNYYILGHCFLEMRQYDSAAYYYLKAKSMAPEWALPLNGLGVCMEFKKDWPKALGYYHEALGIDSACSPALHNIGNTYLKFLKNNDSASKYFLKAIAVDSNYSLSYDGLGAMYIKLYDKCSKTDKDRYFDLAKENLLKAIASDSNFISPYGRLSFLYSKINFDSSEIWMLRCQEKNPTNPMVKEYLGWFYFESKHYKNAEEYYLKAIALDSDVNSSWNNLGLCYEKSQNRKKAETCYRKAIAAESTNIYPYYNLAKLYSKIKFDSSEKLMSICREKNPDNALAFFYSGELAEEIKDYKRAEEYYLKAIALDSGNCAYWNELGGISGENSSTSSAIEYFRKAISIDSNYLPATANMAWCFSKQGKLDSAFTYYWKCLKIDSSSADSWYRIGNLYVESGNDSLGVVCFKKSVGYDSTEKNILYYLGSILAYLHQYDSSIKYLHKAVNIDSAYAKAWINLGASYYQKSQKDSAEKYYRLATKFGAFDVEAFRNAFYNLGGIYNSKNIYDSAILFYRKSVAIDSTFSLPWGGLGKTFVALKSYDSAINCFKRQIDLDSNNEQAYTDLGYAYLRLNDLAASKSNFLKALVKSENSPACFYDLACFYSLQNDLVNGFFYLEEALKRHFNDYDHLLEDEDISNLRANEKFNLLMQKYFPEKIKK